jgi:hypothetical protein
MNLDKNNCKSDQKPISGLKGCNPNRMFALGSMSPESKNDSNTSLLNSSSTRYGTNRCNSPKSSVIKYDSMGNIVDLPEEYEEFLKRKFAKLASNRTTNKRYESRNSLKVMNTTASTVKILNTSSKVNRSKQTHNKENEFSGQKPVTKYTTILGRRNSALNSLSKTLAQKEMARTRPVGLYENKSMSNLNNSSIGRSKPKITTPKTCKVKKSCPKLYLNKASKNLFGKILTRTPTTSKLKSIVPILNSNPQPRVSKVLNNAKTVKINLGPTESTQVSETHDGSMTSDSGASVAAVVVSAVTNMSINKPEETIDRNQFLDQCLSSFGKDPSSDKLSPESEKSR